MNPNDLEAPVQLAQHLGLAVALAVFFGLAFEEVYKQADRTSPGGIRTFPLLTLAGALLYLVESQHATAFTAGLLALAAWLHAYLRAGATTGAQIAGSLMIPVSNLFAYTIGAIALVQPPWVALSATIVAVLLLTTRETMHQLVLRIPQDELLTAGKFLVLVGIILPLLPNRPVSALTPLTPHQAWLALVAICALSYASYLINQYLPLRGGALLPALLGGVYSSTATTVVLAKYLRDTPGVRRDIAAGITAATAVMYLRLLLIVALFDMGLAVRLAPAMVGLSAGGAVLVALRWPWRNGDHGAVAVPTNNPLQIPTAALFAVLFVVVSVVSSWVRHQFGQEGIFILAAIVGATDIDPFIFSIAQGGVPGMTDAALAATVLIAASSNNVMKACYAIGFGGWMRAGSAGIDLGILSAAGAAAAWLMLQT